MAFCGKEDQISCSASEIVFNSAQMRELIVYNPSKAVSVSGVWPYVKQGGPNHNRYTRRYSSSCTEIREHPEQLTQTLPVKIIPLLEINQSINQSQNYYSGPSERVTARTTEQC